MTREELFDVLTRYESAIQRSDSDDEEDTFELDDAREELMNLLLKSKENL